MGVSNGIFYIFFKMMYGVFSSSALLHVFWVRFWSNMVVYRTLAASARVCWIIKFIFKIPFQNIYFKNIIQIFSMRKWFFWQFWHLKTIIYVYIYIVPKLPRYYGSSKFFCSHFEIARFHSYFEESHFNV